MINCNDCILWWWYIHVCDIFLCDLDITLRGLLENAMPCHAMPCHDMPCHAMPCHAMPCHAKPSQAKPRHALPCYAMPCHAMPCHFIFNQHCYAMLFLPTLKKQFLLFKVILPSNCLFQYLLCGLCRYQDRRKPEFGTKPYTLQYTVPYAVLNVSDLWNDG